MFFLDRDLGRYEVAEAIRSLGATVKVHADHFPHDIQDTDWLEEVGRNRWVVLTRDRHIRTRPLEVMAFLRANVHAFVLRSRRGLNGEEMAKAFTMAYEDMCGLVASHPPPLIARVTAAGNVSKIEGYEKIVRRIGRHK